MFIGLASVAGEVTGWLVTLALFVFPGLVAAGLCAPFLAAERLRALFVALPPGGRLLTSYVGVSIALSTPYLAGVALTVGLVDSAGAAWSNAIVETALVGGLLTTVVAPAAAVLALPRLGVDWDPTGYGPMTWGLLLAAGLTYAIIAAVPLFGLAVVFGLPGGY